jgi:hypothetical protein
VGDKFCWVLRFWIWVMLVMLYMWSLLRHLVACFFSHFERVKRNGCVFPCEFVVLKNLY